MSYRGRPNKTAVDSISYAGSDNRALSLFLLIATSVEKAILFGSYAKGSQTEARDVDIFIDCKGKIRGIDFFGILDDITEALNVSVDLIEASQIIDGGRAQQEIAETGIVIYESVRSRGTVHLLAGCSSLNPV